MGEIGPQPREGLRLMKMARDSYGAAGRVRVVQQFTRGHFRGRVLGAYRLIMARLSPSQPERAQAGGSSPAANRILFP
jgi:hypothetical protein